VAYLQIAQQPTMLEARQQNPESLTFERVLRAQRFRVSRSNDMDGWLAYHAVLVASIAAALLDCDGDPLRLANDRATLALMCRAIEEGFAALQEQGRHGLPRNLATLHQPILRPFAVRYWARTMRTPTGELCFAGHTRHATDEMITLGTWVLTVVSNSKVPHHHLNVLLSRSA
jgi:2-dehydropantoate 2-reductase